MLTLLLSLLRNPRLAVQFLAAFSAVAKAIAAYEQHAEQRKFAADLTSGWNDAMETGDPTFLHSVIDAHPAVRVRK